MTDSKPYLIRAIYEWICDNEQTPYLYVDTRAQNLLLPEHLYADNPLILNISPSACQNLQLGNEDITFQARFSGKVFDIYLPIGAIMAIVARENGQGMTFEVTLDENDSDADTDDENNKNKSEKNTNTQEKPKKKKGGLKVVK